MWKNFISLFKSKETKAREAEEAAQAEAYLEAERLRKEENLRAYRAAPTIPTTKSAPHPQRVNRNTRQKEPAVVNDYRSSNSNDNGFAVNSMIVMATIDDTPSRSSYSNSNNYCNSSSDYSSSYSGSTSDSSSSSSSGSSCD